MFRISKEFTFSASHQLKGLPEDHPCSRLHGHNYTVIIELEANELNDVGFVTDYRELEPIKKIIDSKFDHRHLNDVLDFNPTAELMAKHFYHLFIRTYSRLNAVSVKETDKTIATYEPKRN
jgi:6-pyruvoyltetrahydropterin/6-carboxytetrahydropterin synthase